MLDPTEYRITGKERDSETGLDYFGARYYGSNLARFLSADPKAGSATRFDPQSWNRYAYARDNPMKYIDPDGRDIVMAANADRAFIVKQLARVYATPQGKQWLQNLDKSKYVIAVGTRDLPKKEAPVDKPGSTTFGKSVNHYEPGLTQANSDISSGQRVLQGFEKPDVEVSIDPKQKSAMDPAKALAHELGGHTTDIINMAEKNGGDISGYDPDDEKSSKQAEKDLGKPPKEKDVTEEDINAVEKLLEKKEEPK